MTNKQESLKIRKMVFWYNMIPSLFWSGLNLIPIAVFCYSKMNAVLFYIFLAISLLTLLLPNSFFNQIQLGKTTVVYNRIGVQFVNRFTQNGDIINRLIRRKIPHYKVIGTKARSVDHLLQQTYMFEKFHFMMLLFFSLTTVYALIEGYLPWALIMSLTNFIYNVYPNLLQQYIRIRLTMLRRNNLK